MRAWRTVLAVLGLAAVFAVGASVHDIVWNGHGQSTPQADIVWNVVGNGNGIQGS